MMHRKILLCLLGSIVLVIGGLARVGHVTEPEIGPPQQTSPHARASAADLEHARTLAELQQQLGGSLLEGTLLNDADAPSIQQEFVEAVQREQCESRYQQMLQEPDSFERQTIGAPAAYLPVDMARLPQTYHASAASDLSAVLRAAGRHLDAHASDLEDTGDYDRSEELRRLAKRIRRVAREFRSDAGPAEVAEKFGP